MSGRRAPRWVAGHRVTAYPWPEIAAFFRWIVQTGGAWLAPMLELTERIAASPEGERIWAITSMHTLLVSNTPEFETAAEVLRIDYDPRAGEFAFEYVEQPNVGTRWRRRCPPAEAFSTLQRFIHLKGWMRELPPEARARD